MPPHYSYWFQDALKQEGDVTVRQLNQDIQTDIAIVGGGYTGLWSAILIKQQQPELNVTVIEKGLCGSGASGANGGCMLTWATKYPTLKKLYGESEAKWLVEQSECVISEIEQFCLEHDIDAELYRHGTYYTSTNSAQKGGMAPVVEELKRLGINSWSLIQANELKQKAGSDKHIEGYYSEHAASVQPALLARGLRKVAIEMGVELYEQTEMTKLKYGQPAQVVTPNGVVTAGKVILALNAWMLDHFRQFKRSIVVVSSDMVITKSMPEQMKTLGPEQGATVVDSRIFVHYYRDTRDGRLMLGKGGNHFSFANKVDPMFHRPTQYLGLLKRSFQSLFPQLPIDSIEHHWTGGSDRSVTGLPFFGNVKHQDNVFYGLGYSGNGVAQTRIGGKILASMALGLNDKWAKCGLTTGPRGHFPPEPIRWLGAMMVRDAVRRKEAAEDKEQQPMVWDKWLSILAGPAGKADKIK